MPLYSLWPTFVCTLVLVCFAATPLFAAADSPPTAAGKRVRTIDGLRGFLALAVFFHHAAIYHMYLEVHQWLLPPSEFYQHLGPFGVTQFFMITGYLFWSKLIRDGGRPDWLQLYVGRVFRIGPLYLAAVIVMLSAVLILTHFHLHVGILTLVEQLVRWLALGVTRGPAEVNGYADARVLLAGVTWSIHFEWLFYFSLPVLALACRSRRTHLAFALVLLMACLGRVALLRGLEDVPVLPVIGASFAFGMLTGSLVSRGLVLKLRDTLCSCLVLLCFSGYFFFPKAYSFFPLLLLGLAFYLIVCGTSMWGLLTSRPAVRLGDVSYGIYLLQGLALAAVLRPLHRFALGSSYRYWFAALLSGIVLIGLAALTHVLVERRGMLWGAWATKRLRERQTSVALNA